MGKKKRLTPIADAAMGARRLCREDTPPLAHRITDMDYKTCASSSDCAGTLISWKI
jgi:hypothetical protein